MEQIQWPISINIYKNYLLEGLKRAVSQHKWKDTLELLLCVLSTGDYQSDAYFIWKIIHCLMINLNVKLNIQEDILTAFHDYIPDPQVMHLEWVFHSFHIEENKAKSLFKNVIKTAMKRSGEFQNLSSLQCFAYFNIHHYYEWVMELQKNGASLSLLKKGDVIYQSLNENYESLMQYSPAIDKITKNEYELTSHRMCEWLLGPMLNHKILMVKLNYNKYQQNEDLTLLNKYVETTGNHLPALKLCIQYIIYCYPNRKLAIAQLLQRICILSPSDPMVLYYVKFFKKKSAKALRESFKNEKTDINFDSDVEVVPDCSGDELDEFNCRKNSPAREGCIINALSVTVTLHCIQVLLQMLEYPEWQNNIKPWALLTNLLKKLYMSWITCFYCLNCFKSRTKLRQVLRKLALWPLHIWRIQLPQNATHEEALITMHRSFSAYVLGYDRRNVRDATLALDSQNHDLVLQELDNLISFEGEHVLKVRSYLNKNKKRIISKLTLYPEITNSDDCFQITIITDDDLEVIAVDNVSNRKKRKNDSDSSVKPNKRKKDNRP